MWLWVAAARAAELVTVVVSAREGPDRAEVEAALTRAGLRAEALLDGSVLARKLRILPVTRRVADEDCGGTVDLGAWRVEADQARQRFGLAQFEEALAELVSLELQAACLTSPPAASDLFRLELAVAEAHRVLAEVDQQEFHEAEMEEAVRRAAVFGAGLVTPTDTGAEILAALDEARAEVGTGERPRVLVAGPGARSGARFNGRPVSGGPFDALPGLNLVQASVAGTVTAAANLELGPGRPILVWLAPGDRGPTAEDISFDVDSLSTDGLTAEASGRLGAVAWLLDADLVFAGKERGRVALWRAEEGALVPLVLEEGGRAAPAATEEEQGPWTWAVGAAGGGGFASISALEDLGGGRVLGQLYGRVGVAERWNLAATGGGDFVWRELEADEGEGALWHATLPLRIGARYGPRGDAWSPELGIDVGVQYFGRYDGGDAASPIALLAGGVARGLGPRAGARLEAWLGGGMGYLSTGLALGFEARR